AKLGLPPSVNLNAVAKASGTVDLPMRLTNEARGSTTTLSVVSTDGWCERSESRSSPDGGL
ncbi:S-type pyocin domain-containing protein, partial [Pseudomonas aeruginosa]